MLHNQIIVKDKNGKHKFIGLTVFAPHILFTCSYLLLCII